MIEVFVVRFTKDANRISFKDTYLTRIITICKYDFHAHSAVADVLLVGGSDGRFHVRFLQDTVGEPHVEGELTAPGEDMVPASR